MKRDTMKWLRDSREWTRPYIEKRRFAEILAELARLRRIELAARNVTRMNATMGLDVALGELEEALKKGGRK